MPDHLYYDLDGNPTDLHTWSRLFAERFDGDEPGRIGCDRTHGLVVSTVWLGLDHGMPWGDRPTLWETMVFPDGTAEDLYMQRYASRAAAVRGHGLVVKMVRDGLITAPTEEDT
jgi:hypothetical protein